MEYAQWGVQAQGNRQDFVSLNPYSNGICSMRAIAPKVDESNEVLILILMEYAQWVNRWFLRFW